MNLLRYFITGLINNYKNYCSSMSESATTTIHVSGTEIFRRFALFGSLISGAISALIMMSDTRNCDVVDLRMPTYITFSVQLTIFVLLMMHYI